MFVVLIFTGRSKEVPHTSKALIERSLGSLLSHLGLWSRAEDRGRRGGASTSSLSIVLGSSILNTVNLFTGDQSALITGRTTQNPLLLGNKIFQSKLHPSMPVNLQSAPSTVLR